MLENIRKALSSLMNMNAFNVDDLKKALLALGKMAKSLKNLFNALDVYEPSQAFLDAPDGVPTYSRIHGRCRRRPLV
jgi:hypothetical protein